MKKRKKMIWLAGMLLICGMVLSLIFQNRILYGIQSPYAALMERDGDRILAQKKGEKKMYPASLTKIMTCLVALEHISDLDRKVTMDGNMIDQAKAQGASRAGFEAGETVTIRDLLYGAMLPSGAECCLRLSRYVTGSEEKMAELMNQKAENLGMEHTHFVNVTGLHDENHYSTAEDLAVLLNAALDRKDFRKIFTTMSYRTSPSNVHPNGMVLNSTLYEYREELQVKQGEFLGGKTGHTSQAGLCLASLVNVKGKEYILVTAGAEDHGGSIPGHVADAKKIYSKL